VAAAEAFLAVSSQWRCAGLADGRLVRTGLDYAGVRAALEMAGMGMTPDLWSDLRVIETAAINAQGER
jgi:hypothetical protein